ncbi:jg18159 [Pararge aegeria aegeria]|uniref:Jg18159 protein n=1 Tax=Pararge aegeria aegeria TaxID=348720 RepID=A0A8S4SEM1_9NEOP|nr:jg18159 [Pararge aegeria aegeria]
MTYPCLGVAGGGERRTFAAFVFGDGKSGARECFCPAFLFLVPSEDFGLWTRRILTPQYVLGVPDCAGVLLYRQSSSCQNWVCPEMGFLSGHVLVEP